MLESRDGQARLAEDLDEYLSTLLPTVEDGAESSDGESAEQTQIPPHPSSLPCTEAMIGDLASRKDLKNLLEKVQIHDCRKHAETTTADTGSRRSYAPRRLYLSSCMWHSTWHTSRPRRNHLPNSCMKLQERPRDSHSQALLVKFYVFCGIQASLSSRSGVHLISQRIHGDVERCLHRKRSARRAAQSLLAITKTIGRYWQRQHRHLFPRSWYTERQVDYIHASSC